MNIEQHQTFVIFARHAYEDAERRADRAADAVLVAMIAWARMRRSQCHLDEWKPLVKPQSVSVFDIFTR